MANRVINQRLTEFINSVGITKKELERSAGLSNGFVDKAGDSIRSDKVDKILRAYPDLSRSWLMFGEGSMLVEDTYNNNKERPFISEVTPVPTENYIMVEYADLRASAGHLGGGNVDKLPDTQKRLIPAEYKKGNYLVVRVDGDSMNDGTARSLIDGDEVLIKQIHLDSFEGLPIRTSLFVITSKEGNVLKQITEYNKEEGYITCHSFNPAYPDYKIRLEDVFQIFVVCKFVNKRIMI